jgi:hypothetical protein
VATTIRHHPGGCRFVSGAFERVVASIERAMLRENTPECFINTCERALLKEEIYCPREKVDRRSEYGDVKGLSPLEILKEAGYDRTPA